MVCKGRTSIVVCFSRHLFKCASVCRRLSGLLSSVGPDGLHAQLPGSTHTTLCRAYVYVQHAFKRAALHLYACLGRVAYASNFVSHGAP